MKRSPEQENEEKVFLKKIALSSLIPFIFISILWLIKVTENFTGADLSFLGIKPLSPQGLPGILISPLLHENFRHLFNNTLPLFFLSTMLFYFYPDVVFRVLILTWLLTGIMVWLAGRIGVHIGASGMVYGLASFLFFSGILKKHFRLIALSLLIVFMYGEMVWGLFPGNEKNISWESHMLGFFSGIILSIVFIKKGPQPPVYDWMNEDENPDENDNSVSVK